MGLLILAWILFLCRMALSTLDDGTPQLVTDPAYAGMPQFMQPVARWERSLSRELPQAP